MPFDCGINFRATSGFVTDGANETYSIGGVDTSFYPITRAGFTFGWVSSGAGLDQRDRNAGVDRRLAGIVFSSVPGDYFRLDLPSTGNYDIHLALGDDSGGNPVEWKLQDTTTLLATYTGTPGAGNFQDASGATLSAANWPGSEAPLANQTFATTQLRLVVNGSGNNVVAHLRVVAVAGSISGDEDEGIRYLPRVYW